MAMTEQGNTESQHSRASTLVIAVLAAIALVALCLLAFRACSDAGPEGRDPNASLGQLAGKSDAEIQAELDRMVREGMFNISIASQIDYADGTEPGEVRIENVPGNPYLMKVTVARDDTGEAVYSTGIIEPNSHIQSAPLDVDLDAGTYPCTATFYALDPLTEEQVGQASAAVTVRVLS